MPKLLPKVAALIGLDWTHLILCLLDKHFFESCRVNLSFGEERDQR